MAQQMVVEQEQALLAKLSKPNVLSTEKQITCFKDKPQKAGDVTLEEWLFDGRCTVEARKLNPEEHALLPCQHLGGRARQEILARGVAVKGSATEIVKVRRKVFGGGSDLPTAQQRFYSHRQKAGQDLITLSLDLVELYDKIVEVDPSFAGQRKSALKSQFAEAALNETIKREIRRLTREQPELGFLDLRDRLIEWCGTNISSDKEKVVVEEVHTKLDDLVKQQTELIEKQQQQINELLNHHRPRRWGDKICWTCNEKGHFQRNCPNKNQQVSN